METMVTQPLNTLRYKYVPVEAIKPPIITEPDSDQAIHEKCPQDDIYSHREPPPVLYVVREE